MSNSFVSVTMALRFLLMSFSRSNNAPHMRILDASLHSRLEGRIDTCRKFWVASKLTRTLESFHVAATAEHYLLPRVSVTLGEPRCGYPSNGATRLPHINADSNTHSLKIFEEEFRPRNFRCVIPNRSTACHRASTRTTYLTPQKDRPIVF